MLFNKRAANLWIGLYAICHASNVQTPCSRKSNNFYMNCNDTLLCEVVILSAPNLVYVVLVQFYSKSKLNPVFDRDDLYVQWNDPNFILIRKCHVSTAMLFYLS